MNSYAVGSTVTPNRKKSIFTASLPVALQTSSLTTSPSIRVLYTRRLSGSIVTPVCKSSHSSILGLLHQIPLLVQLFKGHTHDDDSPSTGIDSDDHEMDVDQPEDVVPTQPVTHNKRGAKKTRAQEAKAPLSPTRPSTKRPAPTSPTISPPVCTKGKSRKQDEGKAKASSTSLTALGSSSVPPPPRPVIPSAPQVASTSAPVTRARERPKPTIRMQKSVAERASCFLSCLFDILQISLPSRCSPSPNISSSPTVRRWPRPHSLRLQTDFDP